MQQRFIALCLILCSVCVGTLSTAARAEVVDCAALKNKQCHSEFKASTTGSHVDEYMDAKKVQQCINRGFDAPVGCRKDEGKSAGVRVEGSSGFSYGAVQSPENSPGKTGAGASTSHNAMVMNLGFDWSGCKVFGINLCNTGVPGQMNPPAPLVMTDACPEKTDPNQRLGEKKAISTSGLTLPCGGTVPLTNYETTLNVNPDHLAVTEYKSYEMRVYQKANGKYVLNPDYWVEFTVMDPPVPLGIVVDDKPYPEIQIGETDHGLLGLKKKDPLLTHRLVTFRQLKRSPTGTIPLPGYLCGVEMFPNPLLNPPRMVPVNLKTVELTPAIAQMTTYNKQDTINLRLMSRNTLKPVIIKRAAFTIPSPRPWNLKHTTTIPPVVEHVYPPWWFGLPEHLMYFWPEPPEEEIEADEKFLVLPIFQGLPVLPVRQDDPFAMGPVCGLESRFFIKPGKLSGDILIEQPTTLCEGSDSDCKAMKDACILAGGEDCDTITNKPANDLSCETTKLPLKYPDVPQACDGKMQWVVLDRHNMVYPPGTNVTPIAIDPGTALMMPSVENSQIFTQKDTNLRLGSGSPALTLNEGGTLLLSNNKGKIKMFPPATVDVIPASKQLTAADLTLTGGGIWIDNNGGLVATYPKGQKLTVPDPVLPYVINLNRSFALPPGYEYPSASRDNDAGIDPFVKLPLDAPPIPEVTKFTPQIIPKFDAETGTRTSSQNPARGQTTRGPR